MGWIRATFGSFSQQRPKHSLFSSCPSLSGFHQVKTFWTAASSNAKMSRAEKKRVEYIMRGGKSLWVKVVTILPQAMNANITELMEFHSRLFIIEKSENFKKLKLLEISKMVWRVTPFPRSFLTVGKPRTPSPELSDRGQNPASKLTLFYHSCQVIHSNFHIMKISVSSKFLNNQFTVHLHPRNWPYFVEICENRPGLPNNSLQGWSLQPETYKVKFTGKLRGSQIWGEIWENF